MDKTFSYIAESLVNGQRSQVRSLFNELDKHDQLEFLNTYCNHEGVDLFGAGYMQSMRNLLIEELIGDF